ncbi:hypothetical protein THASP1DRAFT_26084, partial [Thamnocephalis sphaerospora]
MPVDCVVAQAHRVLLQQANALTQCAERLLKQPDAYDSAIRILYETLQGHPNAYRLSAQWRPAGAEDNASVCTDDSAQDQHAGEDMTGVASGLNNCCRECGAPPTASAHMHHASWAPRPCKIVVTGVGKSGHVARKVCATLQSTGSLAVFLHPTEALHGDLGVLAPGDALLVFSHSGRTEELVRLVQVLREQQRACRVVAVCGNASSPLGLLSDAWVDARVDAESDPALPAPTASTTLALALGDCLALALARMRAVTARDFAENHPGGNLGR